MPAEDRDRLFEQAMAGELRRTAASPSPGCLDAETLAAYHERLLSVEEMTAAKGHVAACARCQEILARLEATQDLEQPTEQDQESVPVGAAWAMMEAQPAPRASGRVTAAATQARPLDFQERKRRPISRWAVPAGAIAACLLLWIGVRTWQADHRGTFSAKQSAENRNTSDYEFKPNSAPPAETSPHSSETVIQPRPQYGISHNDQPIAGRPKSGALQSSQPSPQFPYNFPAAGGASQSRKVGDQGHTSAAPEARGEMDERQVLDKAVAAPSESQNYRRTEPSLKEEQRSDSISSSQQLSPEAAKAKAVTADDAKKSRAPAPVPNAPPPASAQSSAAAVTAERSANVFRPKDDKQPATLSNAVMNRDAVFTRSVSDPQGKRIWRFGGTGLIAYSGDGGESWQAQASGVLAKLLDGSAPSQNVCWLAGVSGTLLRTTDGGKHWQRVINPVAGDIAGVSATDANHASIWTDGRKSVYQTSDAGLTWLPVAP
jgi:hypothetical protein